MTRRSQAKKTVKPLLIVKTGRTFPAIAARYGDFEDWIISGMALPRDQFLVVSPFLSQPLPAANEVSGVVITGSHAMVSDAEVWSVKTADWLKKIATTNLPILGICYGHQLIAEALGGNVGFHPGGREIGMVKMTKTPAAASDPLFSGLPKTLMVHVAHAQSVLRLPARAELLASNNFEPHHAFVIDNHIWGVQFHPEFNEAITKAYILELQETLQREGFDPSQLISSLKPSPYGAVLLRKFSDIVTGTA
jgi:GMP synthase (glutamine-hydrolysing)